MTAKPKPTQEPANIDRAQIAALGASVQAKPINPPARAVSSMSRD